MPDNDDKYHLRNLYTKKQLKTIKEIGTGEYGFDINLCVNNDDEDVLYQGQNYNIDIKIKIDDKEKRKALLKTFGVYFFTELNDISSHDVFHKFVFDKNSEAKCRLNFKTEKMGTEKLIFTFHQNAAIISSMKLPVEILPPKNETVSPK